MLYVSVAILIHRFVYVNSYNDKEIKRKRQTGMY